MAYQSYWEQISRFDRAIFFLFALAAAGGAISAAGFTLIWIAMLRDGGRVWTEGIYLTAMAMLSVCVSLAYVPILVLRSANPAYWAKRAILPIILIALPLGALFVEAMWIDMKPKPASRSTPAVA